MARTQYNEEPARIKYMPLPDGKHADVRLRTNIAHTATDDGEIWTADEHYFRAPGYMTAAYVAEHFEELLDYEPEDENEESTEELLLEMAADHEYRLCLLELGVEI